MSGFEDAVRNLFAAPPEANVSVEITGGGQVQIGEYTWDTEPTEIEVTVSWGVGQARSYLVRKFDTIPDLWEALSE